MQRDRLKFHLVMAGCGAFVVLALAALAYVCSRPQTAGVQSGEARAIERCLQRSQDPARRAIQRQAQADSCREMRKQYLHKFGEDAPPPGEAS
ncbi:MAG: hypothetical protein GAK31_02713 [Stenotrophomonas maltophilia]|uniref:Transmembrane protein n=1 Tax=Stenotrophomonas maltophilia TaxID=40324 RepID=A0A7V8FGR8_STEMA|nr:MAG: hypothetical protein GAK31_02713 [Stenotrophomonas maltophilia]